MESTTTWTRNIRIRLDSSTHVWNRKIPYAIPLPLMGAGWGGGDMGTSNARRLRKNLTDAERALWARLRRKQLDGVRFRQQVPLGPYVIDFLCPEQRLIIEIDGGQHALATAADETRTACSQCSEVAKNTHATSRRPSIISVSSSAPSCILALSEPKLSRTPSWRMLLGHPCNKIVNAI